MRLPGGSEVAAVAEVGAAVPRAWEALGSCPARRNRTGLGGNPRWHLTHQMYCLLHAACNLKLRTKIIISDKILDSRQSDAALLTSSVGIKSAQA